MPANRVTVVDPGGDSKAIRHLDPICTEIGRAPTDQIIGVFGATATVRALTRRCSVCFAEVERREAAARRRRRGALAPPEVLEVRSDAAKGAREPSSSQSGRRGPRSGRGRALLLETARCPLVKECLESASADHPCSTIVLDQWRGIDVSERIGSWERRHQLPEPWDGHLASAPILFVSSNPSISGDVRTGRPRELEEDPPESFLGHSASDHPSIRKLGQGPRWYWSDDEIVDRYESAFDLYIADGVANRRHDGTRTGPTRFWIEVRARARELIPDRPVRPGIDYALTEAVRCKSRAERGVAAAIGTCSTRYLRRTIDVSGAVVVVALGRLARLAVQQHLRLAGAEKFYEGVVVNGRPRIVAFLPHPNARMARTLAANLPGDQIDRMRAVVSQSTAQHGALS